MRVCARDIQTAAHGEVRMKRKRQMTQNFSNSNGIIECWLVWFYCRVVDAVTTAAYLASSSSFHIFLVLRYRQCRCVCVCARLIAFKHKLLVFHIADRRLRFSSCSRDS